MRRSTSEPAARDRCDRSRLCRRPANRSNSQRRRPSYTVSPAGQRHFHRKPLAGRRKPRRRVGRQRGHKELTWGFGPSWATRELQPLRSVTQADSAQERPRPKPGPVRGVGLIRLPRVASCSGGASSCAAGPNRFKVTQHRLSYGDFLMQKWELTYEIVGSAVAIGALLVLLWRLGLVS